MKNTGGHEERDTRPELKLIHSRGGKIEPSENRKLLDGYADLVEQDVLVADGFDEAIIGYCEAWEGSIRPMKAVYSREKCIEVLMRDMSRDEAEEYFEYNVAGAYVGPNTPIFVELF